MTKRDMRQREWWRDAVIYQIYPRSFQDTTGNGMGDLAGIAQRLSHVASLGVDAIWLSPVFTSPDLDMGYDVSDYTGISELYGTLADFDNVIATAHDLGLRVIVDQVLSHSSDRHIWFEQSRQSRDNARADWYVWADPKPDGTAPTNWLSHFGGPAWTFEPRRRQYYMHNFLTQQPDLNFHNPDVVQAHLDNMRFWLDRGVDGFRLDTVNMYVHDKKLRDDLPGDWADHGDGTFPATPYNAQNHIHSKTQPENLDVLARMRSLCDEYDDRMMVGEVGEMGRRQVEIMGEYTDGDTRLHMAYSFALLSHDQSPDHFRNVVGTFLDIAPGGWPYWSFSNHDVERHVSRWTAPGGDTDAVARQAIALLTSLPGALGIYQGEELGQTETDILFDELRDTANIAFWPDSKGRDGCRTPMVWEADAKNAGFSDADPWLPVKAPQAARAVDTQDGRNDSVLAHYRATLGHRKSCDPLRLGSTEMPVLDGPVLAVVRTHEGTVVTALFNLSEAAHSVAFEGTATPRGPQEATVVGGCVHMPAHGYVFLESDAPLGLGTVSPGD